MIETQAFQHQSPVVDPWVQGSCEGCRLLIAEAEREMGAFVSAVREIFGLAAAARAAAYWIELVETASPWAVEGRPNWRKLTIMASSRLAAETKIDRQSAKNEVGMRRRKEQYMKSALSPQVPSSGRLKPSEERLRLNLQRCVRIAAIAAILCGFGPWTMAQQTASSDPAVSSGDVKGKRVQNIVLVHGAWTDGSGWKDVYDILVKDGFNVSIVQQPETSFKDDVSATRRVLAHQNGPCILAAHSYGGAVITEAGTDPSVAALVYVAAHMPDAGENEADDGKRFPSDLSKSTAIKKTADGFTYLEPAQFQAYFAADLPADKAAFMASSQVFNLAENFRGVISKPAWREKPSWMVVATKDRTINPDLERWYAKRAKSHVVELAGASHSVYASRPKEVAAVIEDAAEHAQ